MDALRNLSRSETLECLEIKPVKVSCQMAADGFGKPRHVQMAALWNTWHRSTATPSSFFLSQRTWDLYLQCRKISAPILLFYLPFFFVLSPPFNPKHNYFLMPPNISIRSAVIWGHDAVFEQSVYHIKKKTQAARSWQDELLCVPSNLANRGGCPFQKHGSRRRATKTYNREVEWVNRVIMCAGWNPHLARLSNTILNDWCTGTMRALLK